MREKIKEIISQISTSSYDYDFPDNEQEEFVSAICSTIKEELEKIVIIDNKVITVKPSILFELINSLEKE